MRAIRDGAREFLPLPPDPDLIAAILEAPSADTHALIVRDPVTPAIAARAEQVAASEASVLITGETGTGKEVLARHIHRRSRRTGGPFIALNCAAIPENLLESELFGHEKGAFTGAVARRVGKFEAADRRHAAARRNQRDGCAPAGQAAARRAGTRDRPGRRLGAGEGGRAHPRHHQPRPAAPKSRADRFREDLYFRLNVVSLRIPPLRERPGDIPPLAEHFARRYAEVNGLPVRPLTAAAQQRLRAHGWRGNVRELENAMHRAVLLATAARSTPTRSNSAADRCCLRTGRRCSPAGWRCTRASRPWSGAAWTRSSAT